MKRLGDVPDGLGGKPRSGCGRHDQRDGSYDNTYTYLPFGGVLTSSGVTQSPFQFVGQFGVLTGSSVILMGARAYSPGTGQFVSNDPLGLNGGDTNVRRYVGNNPASLVDPLGLQEQGLRSFSNGGKAYPSSDIAIADNEISPRMLDQNVDTEPCGTRRTISIQSNGLRPSVPPPYPAMARFIGPI